MSQVRACPECGAPSTKAMYAGMPMWLCSDAVQCVCVFGGLSWLMPVLMLFHVGDDFVFIRYRDYWPCLWQFLTGTINRKANL